MGFARIGPTQSRTSVELCGWVKSISRRSFDVEADMDSITNVDVWNFVGSMPLFIVWIVGIVFCVVRASQQAQACILAGIAIVIAIGSRFILPLIIKFLFATFLHGAGSSVHAFVSGAMYGVLAATSWGLL